MSTTIDIRVNDVNFIMEVHLDEWGTSHIELTEACNHNDLGCMHTIYDFKEIN